MHMCEVRNVCMWFHRLGNLPTSKVPSFFSIHFMQLNPNLFFLFPTFKHPTDAEGPFG